MLAEGSAMRGLLTHLRRRIGRGVPRPATADGGAGLSEPDAGAVEARVMAGQLHLLDSSAPGAIGGVAAAIVFALIARSELSAVASALWIGAMAAVVAALLVWVAATRHGGGDGDASATARRLRIHIAFAIACGIGWGWPSIAFGRDLSSGHMMLLTMIVLSTTAACCAALGACLPAFFGYCLAALLPLAFVSLFRSDDEAVAIAFVAILYIPILAGIVRSYNDNALGALRLRARNEVLAQRLAAAEAATTAATRSKWDTLAHLSHELRTPMNAIIGFSELMREQVFGALAPRYHGYSADINTSGRYALDLVDAILDASRAEAGQIALAETRIEPAPFVAECVRMVEPAAAERQIALAVGGDAPPEIVGDRAKLRQILLNLLTNAIRYTRPGGHVAVETRITDGGLVVTVADDGIGIAAADLARCLEPFVRLSNPMTKEVAGVGLGLPLAKRLIEAHGGTLQIASTPGEGTTVTIRLPAERCAPSAARSAPQVPPGIGFASPAPI
jgi:two-component system cell cycle sensor histidine kinase PleC